MPEYTGKDLLLNWVHSGGTVALNGDFRTVNWQPTTDMADATAGADTTRVRIATIKDATAAVQLLAQTGGTALLTLLAAGTNGTLIIQPEGTATGKVKITFPSISAGAQYTFPYNDVVAISCNFSANGAFTEGAN
jgi:hypothetical protein